ncbi:MAG: hypothetical protein FJ388_22650, partial [Verrucomicrobia bacterium]|nr:hypothetical protein [Verrucomicrobiota bacterium]
ETSCSFGFRVCIGPDVLGSAAKRPGSAGVPPAGVAEPKAKEVAKPVTTPSVASTSPPPMAVGTRALPRDDAFIKKVAGLPADQQLAAVVAKLKELNPNFDGKEAHKIEGGAVTEFGTSSVGVTDITPLKALKWLKKLSIAPATLNQKGALSDLSALQGMPLTGLWCQNNPISDLSPLRGMPLTVLSVGGTQVTELSPLAGMKLTVLSVNDTAVSDLAPLDGMPLTVLWCNNTKVTDLSRLSAMPLVELKCDFVPQRDAAILRGIKTLTKINDQPAGAFWMRVPGSAGILPASGRPASTTAAGKMPALPGTATTPPLAPTVGRAQPGQPFATSVGMELVWIPPGEFLLGSTKEERTRLGYGDITNEGDQPRKAVIKQGFWLGKTEVTVGQWKEFVSATGFQTEAEKKGRSDWAFGGQTVGASWKDPKFGSAPKDKHPVCCVSWEDAAAFCQWLEEREQKAGRLPSGYKIRLPTEAEWEYAC